jgi:hypothetical protein
MKSVYFDESGNTGQNLFDPADPIFVLASCCFDDSAKDSLLEHFKNFKGPELKFSRLRRSPVGERTVLDFLASDLVNSGSSAAVVFHKPFMVVAKYCDLILEPTFHEIGLNFYERGLNLATTNLLYTTMPVFVGETPWLNFLASFVRVVRERSSQRFSEWRISAELLFSHLEFENPEASHYLVPVLMLRNVDDLLRKLSADELDPIVPAYHSSMNHWGTVLNARFTVYADESKALAAARDRLIQLADPSLKPFKAGFDRRRMEFPLKNDSVTAVDSAAHFQVQLADILSGAISAAAKVRFKKPLEPGTFAYEVFDICFAKGIVFDGMWPSRDVDPRSLGTDEAPCNSDIDLPTYTAMILKGAPSTRHTAGF